jgi:hypothetical protein
MKLDVELAEREALEGAGHVLEAGILGVSLEMTFQPWLIGGALFSEVDTLLRESGFVLFDLILGRRGRKAFSQASTYDEGGWTSIGQIVTGEGLYLRDAVDALRYCRGGFSYDRIRIVKLLAIMDLFSLRDCTVELATEAAAAELLTDTERDLIVAHSQPAHEALLKPEIDILSRDWTGLGIPQTMYRRLRRKAGRVYRALRSDW